MAGKQPRASLSAVHVARARCMQSPWRVRVLRCGRGEELQVRSTINGISPRRLLQCMQDQGARAVVVAACRKACDPSLLCKYTDTAAGC